MVMMRLWTRLKYIYITERDNMKRLSLILILVGIVCISGRDIEPELVEISPVEDINDVRIRTVYQYKVELDGREKIIESETELTREQYNEQYVAVIENRLKEIDSVVRSMTIEDCFDIEKPWSLYGRVIQYNYRMKLPDGKKQWINSDIPLTQEDCFRIIRTSYRNQLKEELYDSLE